MTNKRAVLLFGGFNPFTNAHLMIGQLARQQYPDYEIIYVPAKTAYFKVWKAMETGIIDDRFRLDMIKSAVEPLGFKVSDIEIEGIVNGRTWNTVEYFKNQLNYTEIVLCMGTDKVSELETWYMGPRLIAENRFLIIMRAGQSLDDVMTAYTQSHSENFTQLFNDKLSELSATAVRKALSEGNLDYVQKNVPEAVYRALVQVTE